jgi:succinate-acetate transporter protein
MRRIWTEEGEVHTDVALEKVHEAELWREATMATPMPLGLASMAIAIFVWGLGMAFTIPAIAWVPVLSVFGGLIPLVMALFALRKGRAFAATFLGIVGGFFLTWGAYILYGSMFVAAAAARGAPGVAPALISGLTGVLSILLFVTAFILVYLCFCAIQHSIALMLVLLTLPISFVLVGIGLLTAGVILQVGGWVAIASALLAAYTSFAIAWNSVTHKESVPIGLRYAEIVYAKP